MPAPLASDDVLARARRIRVFLMDVDGTLTDGSVCILGPVQTPEGVEPGDVPTTELKAFNSQDGQGLTLAHSMGIRTGVITGRRSPAVARRAKEMKMEFVYLGQAKKTAALEEVLAKTGAAAEEVCYMGDDLPDMPIAERVGLAVCVADGAPELKAVCHYITTRHAGRGAAREVVELILKSQGRWEEAIPKALA